MTDIVELLSLLRRFGELQANSPCGVSGPQRVSRWQLLPSARRSYSLLSSPGITKKALLNVAFSVRFKFSVQTALIPVPTACSAFFRAFPILSSVTLTENAADTITFEAKTSGGGARR